MDPIRWEQIQDVFLEAAELPAEERAAFLERRCAADPELQAEVESLLTADGGVDDVLDATLDDLVALLEDEGDAGRVETALSRAGPYRIHEEIGRGGMGVVYRAERDDDQYTRQVALKVVSVHGRSAEETAGRFRRERQILAGLEHPAVARLYDAGVADDGRPWLAMELVRGKPIHRWCDNRELTVAERVRLFEQVVEGVDYAHRNLVVHRDLKPSNILVTESGEVMLLDFGIAKLLADDSGSGAVDEDDPLTRMDQRILTPEYASPEQIDGRPLTIASDVYSLGVLLHQVLTGRRPAVDSTTRETTTSPSAVVTRSEGDGAAASDPQAVARARRTTPARLQRSLKGELDTIILKALRPGVAERYPSAAALLDDLRRWRTGRPLTARPPSLGYQLRKFVGRNRVPVGAGAAVVAALVVGLGVALHQASIARSERDVAASVSGFLESLFIASSPIEQRGERLDTLRIQAFLERAVERLDTALADQPEVRARMQRVLGSVHENLGIYDRARPLLEASLEAHRTLGGEEHPEVRRALTSLGRVALGADDLDRSEGYYREALALAVAAHGERSREAADLRLELAGPLLEGDRIAAAEEQIAVALDVRSGDLNERSAEVASRLNLLGALQYRQGKLEEAIITMRRAVEMNREVLGPDHPVSAITSHNFGLTLHRAGRSAEAEPYLRESLRAFESVMGPDYPNLGPAMKALANALGALGGTPEADSLFRASIAHSRRIQGEGRDLAIALHDYGMALMDRGRYEESEALFAEAMDIERRISGPGSTAVGITLGTAAEARRRSGDAVGAEGMFREALAVLSDVFPSTHPRVLTVRGGVGMSLLDLGRIDEAREILDAVHQDARTVQDGGVALREAAANLARWHDAAGTAEEAARFRGIADGSGG